MPNDKKLYFEGNAVGMVILCIVPMILALPPILLKIFGIEFTEGVASNILGDGIYLLFVLGFIFAEYEFCKMLIYRNRFILIEDEYLNVVCHGRVSISLVSSISIEKGFLFDKITISTPGGRTINIKSYLLKDKLEDIVGALNKFVKNR